VKTSKPWRADNIGRYLQNAVWRFETQVLARLAEAGHAEVNLTHINLTRHLDVEGTRLTELARRAMMTKQSMGELVVQVERLGLVARHADPTDGRAKIVRFTPEGLAWLNDFRRALKKAERDMQRELGDEPFGVLKQALAAYGGSRPSPDVAADNGAGDT
jgi:DNA-binding MarR family transcriptional regulator